MSGTQLLQRAIADAVTEGAGLLERLAWATRMPVPDVPGAIRSLSEQWSLSGRTQELVIASLLSEKPAQQETVYGLVQAFTAAAHHLNPEERYRVETLAGRLTETGVPPLSRQRAASAFAPDSLPPMQIVDGNQMLSNAGR